MALVSCSNVLYGVMAIYVLVTGLTVYKLFNPPQCDPETARRCFIPTKHFQKPYDLHIWFGDSWCSPPGPTRKHDSPGCIDLTRNSTYNYTSIPPTESRKWEIPVPLPEGARANGTVVMTAILTKEGFKPRRATKPKHKTRMIRTDVKLTRYLPVRTFTARNLLTDNTTGGPEITYGEVVTHWKGRVKLRVVSINGNLLKDPAETPDLWHWPTTPNHWLPYFYNDETSLFRQHYSVLSNDTSKPDPPLTIELLPTSLGSFRILSHVHGMVGKLKQFGFSEEDLEEVLYMLAPERLFRMLLTWVISMLHMLFSFLAFKNEVGFWSGRETVAGLSQSAIIGNAICSIIIFLFLLDSDHTSRVVLVTVGTSTLIDMWKVSKVLKVQWSWTAMPRLKESTKKETQTREFDVQGIRYLSIALAPILVGWSIYCLYHYKYKSWYSWFISSAANGVYGFGFVLMTPQIFINYKLKSVAHLPWRALMYKAFNTFVDDAFAWIIEMPTAHRLATLRDDLVFFVYLYQRYLYPVDLKRANEFGYSYEKKGDDGNGGGNGDKTDKDDDDAQPKNLLEDTDQKTTKPFVGFKESADDDEDEDEDEDENEEDARPPVEAQQVDPSEVQATADAAAAAQILSAQTAGGMRKRK